MTEIVIDDVTGQDMGEVVYGITDDHIRKG